MQAIASLGPCWAVPEASAAVLAVARRLLADLEQLAVGPAGGSARSEPPALSDAAGPQVADVPPHDGVAPGPEMADAEGSAAARLGRFCSLAGCLVALLRAFGEEAPRGAAAAAAEVPLRLARLLVATHRRAAAAMGAEGARDAERAAVARLACDAARLGLLAVAAAASFGEEPPALPGDTGATKAGRTGGVEGGRGGGGEGQGEGEGVGALAPEVWEAARACLAMAALPRWHAAQLLLAAEGHLRACMGPRIAAVRLRQAAAAAWPGLAAAAARARAGPHVDVARAAAAAWLAALRQGQGSAVGAAACECLVAEVEGLWASLADGPATVRLPNGGGPKDPGTASAGDGSSNGAGGSADGCASSREGRKAAAGTAAPGSGQGATGAPGERDEACPRRLLAFDLSVLQAWADTEEAPAAAGAPRAASPTLPVALAAAEVAGTLLRAAAAAAPAAGGEGAAAADPEMAGVCVGVLDALARRACRGPVVVPGPCGGARPKLPSAAEEAGAGARGASPGGSTDGDDEAVRLARAAVDGLEFAVAAAGLPAEVRAAALRSAAAAAGAAPGDGRGLAIARAAAAMAHAAAGAREPLLRLLAANAARGAAAAAASCRGTPGAGSTVRRAAALLLALAGDEAAPVAVAARAAVRALALPIYLLALAPAPAPAAESSPQPISTAAGGGGNGGGGNQAAGGGAPVAGAADGLAPAGREALSLQHQMRGFRPAQLAEAFEELLQAAPGRMLLAKRPGGGRDGGSGGCDGGGGGLLGANPAGERGGRFIDPALLRLARELPPLPPAGGPSEGGAGQPAQRAQQAEGRAVDPQDLTTAAAAGWYLTQEAARHSVAARMRTHLGGPTEGFAALERALQGALARVHAAAPAAQGGGGQGGTGAGGRGAAAADEDAMLAARHGAAHLLEFLAALEAGIHTAAEGCLARPAPAQGVVAFFAANARVRGRAAARG
jgi:hypothetical protein